MVSLFGIKILQHTVWTAYCNCLDICFWIACTSMLIRKHFKAYFFLAVSFFFFMPFSQENLANFQDWADSILLFKTSVSSHATKHNKGGGVTLDLIYNNQNENNWHKWYFVSTIVLIDYEKKMFQCSRKPFEHLRLKSENLQNFWDP